MNNFDEFADAQHNMTFDGILILIIKAAILKKRVLENFLILFLITHPIQLYLN
jgi:hypothetical protein